MTDQVQGCEYAHKGTRGEYQGTICKLTERSCFADADLVHSYLKCIRRTWALDLATKNQAPTTEGPGEPQPG